MDKSIIQRLRHYVGKDRQQVSNPCITAREAIVIADYIDELEKRVAATPDIIATFECTDGCITGSTNAPIKAIERHDDGCIEVVINHWPEKENRHGS